MLKKQIFRLQSNNTITLIAVAISRSKMVFCRDRDILCLLPGFEASWNTLDDLVEETFVEESHRVSIFLRYGRNNSV